MINLRKISPMVRSIGTVGAVAGLVGAVTFANLTSNTVALEPNTITTAGASLVIENTGGCEATVNTSTPGINAPALVPGGPASTKAFCIKNTGDVPLNLSAVIDVDFSANTLASFVNFSVSCGALGSPTTTLNLWSPETFGGGSLAAGDTVECTASANLLGAYSGSGDQSLPAFKVVFTGTQA